MKDKAILVAVVVLIGLVSLLLVISLQRSKELAKATERISQIEMAKPEIVDYGKVAEITRQYIQQQFANLPRQHDGINGVDGTNGKDGNNGKDGRDGADGKSAYELWLGAGNEGTVKEFLDSLKGEKGDPGQTPQLRLNPTTGEVETKLPTDFFWQTVQTCTEVC